LSYTQSSTKDSRTTEFTDLNLYNYTPSIRIKDGYSDEIVYEMNLSKSNYIFIWPFRVIFILSAIESIRLFLFTIYF